MQKQMMEAKPALVKNDPNKVKEVFKLYFFLNIFYSVLKLLFGQEAQKVPDEGPKGIKILKRGAGQEHIRNLHDKNRLFIIL
jgi:hypothetical protein